MAHGDSVAKHDKHQRKDGDKKSILDAILGNPLVGLSPWILYSLVEGESRLEVAAACAFGLAVVILSLNWLRGGRPKMLEYSDVVFFAGLALVVAFASDDTYEWLEKWGGEIANLALVTITLGSVLVRHPFTLAYAKEDAPPEVWHTHEFMRINYVISWVWIGAFAIEAASGFYGDAVLDDPNNIWTGWIIQTFPLIIAAQFTLWYPDRLAAIREGHATDAPTVGEFLGTLTPWISVIGIITLFVGGTPEWVGIALIVIGVVLTRIFAHKRHQARQAATAG